MKKITAIVVLSLLVLGGFKLLPISNSDNPQSNAVPTIALITKNSDLLKHIHSYAAEHNADPIDATVDKIWKAIPGYNGLDIDVDASYLNMLQSEDFEVDLLIYDEIPPKVHLNELPPSPIYKGNSEKPMNALLINVAWGNEFIPKMLKTLEEHDAKATFFFDGSWVKENGEIAKMIHEKGHEIGNHAYSHPNLQHKSHADTTEELQKTNDVIEATIGVKPMWFAPPSGSFNQQTIDIANDLDMHTILWTVDTVDWKKPATDEMVKRILSKIDRGSMILMHPTKPTAEGLDDIIKGIQKKGFQIGTVSELMSEKRILEHANDDASTK